MTTWNDINATWDTLGASQETTLTYLDLVNTTLRRLNEVTLTSSNFAAATGFHGVVKEAVNAALLDIHMAEFEWPFNHFATEQVLTAGVASYTPPVRTVRVDFKSYYLERDDTIGVSAYTVKPITHEYYVSCYRDRDSAGATGKPEAVAYTATGALIVTPVPDEAYTLAYEGWAYPADLSAASDPTQIPLQFKQIIVEGALYHCHLFRQNAEAAQISLKKFRDGLMKMRMVLIPRPAYVTDTRVHVTKRNIWY